MSRITDGACTVHEAFDDDADQYPDGPPAAPVTSRALVNELKHFRRMAGIEKDPAAKALWGRLGDEVEAYITPPVAAPDLFGGGQP